VTEAYEPTHQDNEQTIWNSAAAAKGWQYSEAHSGWIRDDHGGTCITAQEACKLSGIDNLLDAMSVTPMAAQVGVGEGL